MRGSGRLYEAMVATLHHRARLDPYHSASIVQWNNQAFAIEMAPAWAVHAPDRGVTGAGPVGMPSWGRARLFRYEIRCWPDGAIPDVADAVDSPRRVSTNETKADAYSNRRPPSLPPPAAATSKTGERPVGLGEGLAGDHWTGPTVMAILPRTVPASRCLIASAASASG